MHWSRKVRKKSAQNKFGHFWKCFSGFWKNEIFSVFLNFFRLLDPPGCTGINFLPEKIPRGMLKTCSNTFGNVFVHFEKMKVFQFFEVFPSLDLPGCTGQFFLRKLPQNKFETCLDTSKNVLDTFEKSNFFRFFFEFLQNSISRLHWARKNRKNYLKQVWTLLERFFGILELWNLFDFCGFFFLVSCVHWAQCFPSKNSIKTFSNKVFGNIFGQFWKFRSFSFFKSFFQASTLQGALATFFLNKITSKKVQNMFGQY